MTVSTKASEYVNTPVVVLIVAFPYIQPLKHPGTIMYICPLNVEVSDAQVLHQPYQ